MSLAIDLYNALNRPEVDTFTCQLFRLLLKADPFNLHKLSTVYGVEAEMVRLFRAADKRNIEFAEIETVAEANVQATQYVDEWGEASG